MPEVNPKYRLDSARRAGPRRSHVLTVAIVAVFAIITLIVLVSTRDGAETPAPAPPPDSASRPDPTPSATPTPTPTVGRQQSGWVDAEVVRPPTATPTIPPLPVIPTRPPRPTPTVSQCAELAWSTVQVFSPSAQVKVDIRVRNRCSYELGPGNLLIEITGWRQGDRIRSVRGAPFETIRRGFTGDVSIGLPGSEDWYDRIDVVVID
jgi:hypothetical protein